jgi:hypothetical protein
VDRAVAGAVPHVRNTAGGEVGETSLFDVTAKTKTALILLSIAIVFFVSVVIRHWLW